MQEKELRLALVCFGGVSLAIYIHGTTKEVLKLVRASKAFHADPDINAQSRKEYIYPNPDLIDKPDTELIYFDILKALSPELELRVIVDVIAGASAGGMNGIFLGRALAHDLSIDHLRHNWLEEADVSKLIGKKKAASALDKMLSKPLINYFSQKYLGNSALTNHVQEKLPELMNIRKLKPPFDGKHFLGLIYNGLAKMGEVKGHSLMPYGHQFDLYVTVTDYYGFRRLIPMNDPPLIYEQEHRHKFYFSYLNTTRKSGPNSRGTPSEEYNNKHNIIESDFEDIDMPTLSFAARATASYPGGFPPAQLREVDSFMQDMGRVWEKKSYFLKKNFREYKLAGIDPEQTSFLDGSILNNKPFDQAIFAIQGRRAFREVDRCILYIDPNPEHHTISPNGAPPSLLNTLKGALSDIPMNETIHDDLTNIQAHNQKIRTIKTVIDYAKPDIEEQVTNIAGTMLDTIATTEDIAYLRIIATIKSVTDSGFSYSGYARLKLRDTIATITNLIGDICGYDFGSKERRRIFTILYNIAFRDKFDLSDYSEKIKEENRPKLLKWVKKLVQKDESNEALPSWGYFLTRFDIKFQRRRLLCIIKDLNTLYAHNPNDARILDGIKRSIYDILDNIANCENSDFVPAPVRKILLAAFCPISVLDITDDTPDSAIQDILEIHGDNITKAIESLAVVYNLEQFKKASDNLIAEQYHYNWKGDLAKNLAISYIGFAFWDLTTFSITGSSGNGELNEIKINRISPKDKSILHTEKEALPLRGNAMGGFGAFFSRTDRENDYLWGRLNSTERLIDLLYNQAKISQLAHKLDLMALKKRAFLAILDVEEGYLTKIPALFTELRDKINNL